MYRIWRSSNSIFGDEICPDGLHGVEMDETLSALQAYSPETLQQIADAGLNAIWVHGLLRHLVSAEPFPELGSESKIQLDAMQKLIERAAQYGIKVFIYMQPPRALPQANTDFWDKHPDVWGEEEICRGLAIRRLCTSANKVKQWLKNAAAALARNLPELAGVILITASEFPQHCYSHRRRFVPTEWAPLIECPRCREREPEAVVAELITQIRDGIREVSKTIEIVAWNWSWGWEKDSDRRIIEQLPEDIILLVDFERGGYKDLPRRPKFYMDEYSLSYAGPSEKYRTAFEAAQQRGMRVISKLQLGTTHELASVVSLPMIGNIYEKAKFHRDKNIAGFMGCWNFGNMLPNTNVQAFNFFLSKDCRKEKHDALLNFAETYFPTSNPCLVVTAWEIFDQAMNYYPFTIAFLYHGPQNHTLAYKEIYVPAALTGKPTGCSWKFDERGDDLSNSYQLHHTQFSLEDIIERIGKLAAVWQCGVSTLIQAFKDCNDKKSLDELGNAIICGAAWRSTENTYRIFKLRQRWNYSNHEEFARLVDDELNILNTVLPWVKRDHRQGFHIEPHGYMFNVESIISKIAVLEKLKSATIKPCCEVICR